ncbi:MAG TPA: hypothetical protein VFS59_07210 [Gemmatimonadaceae bacterium]|nr:hypothetical protein [Gemmatimonadaceae bacterium]
MAQASTAYPARQQGASSASARPAAAEAADERSVTRLLVIDCPVRGGAGPANAAGPEEGDSTTRALVAALCARAGSQPSSATAIRHVLGSPRDVSDAPRDEANGEHAEQPYADRALSLEPRFRIHLFGDVKFSAIDSLGARNGFSLGQFDLFGRSQLSNELSVLTEATLTALPRNNFNARLERLLLTYWPSDHFVASAGRYHTSIGYYNTAYHHGSWFQTAIGRPLVFAIDGDIGLLPSHTLGISAAGDIPSGALGLRYLAELGSGRAGQSSAAIATQPALADNNTPSVNVALIARPQRWDGLQVGVTAYRDRLTLQDTSKAPIDETIGGVHALYKTDAIEVLTEWLAMRHRARSGGAPNVARGWYVLASRRVGVVRPYVRYDDVDVPKANQVFAFLGRRRGPTAGVRYDFDALAALKLQASHLTQTTRPTLNRVDAQVSFMF